ncbi:hypothetical protein [Sporosarcina highlanderae]|uniref:Uncharacterized protein n=1 Tax=Sporosarcina highlanderae TaxID=3035916 RepID=A0ABT8JL53_9BACL|nr:hypothetical protein [Sporosarcina highlanderae]MDN4605883.1 hypothetical protein [Sporosarcina highlanderae]
MDQKVLLVLANKMGMKDFSYIERNGSYEFAKVQMVISYSED